MPNREPTFHLSLPIGLGLPDRLQLDNGGPFVALHHPANKKHEKFLRLFGFKKVDVLVDRGLEVWNVEKNKESTDG